MTQQEISFLLSIASMMQSCGSTGLGSLSDMECRSAKYMTLQNFAGMCMLTRHGAHMHSRPACLSEVSVLLQA